MQETHQGSVTLVLGGVRSGKSRYAQLLAARWEHVVFVATGAATDDEMRDRIDRHRRDRPAGWVTIEEPLELARVLDEHDGHCDGVVVDCVTLFAANLMERYGDDRTSIERRIEELCSTLRRMQSPVVLVSNEVGSGVVPVSASGRSYRDLLGEMNQRLAQVATDVIWMIAGLPMALKGHLEVLA